MLADSSAPSPAELRVSRRCPALENRESAPGGEGKKNPKSWFICAFSRFNRPGREAGPHRAFPFLFRCKKIGFFAPCFALGEGIWAGERAVGAGNRGGLAAPSSWPYKNNSGGGWGEIKPTPKAKRRSEAAASPRPRSRLSAYFQKFLCFRESLCFPPPSFSPPRTSSLSAAAHGALKSSSVLGCLRGAARSGAERRGGSPRGPGCSGSLSRGPPNRSDPPRPPAPNPI